MQLKLIINPALEMIFKPKFEIFYGIIFCCLFTLSFQSHADDAPAILTQALFPSLDLAQPEITKLNEQISAIEAQHEKKLAEASKMVELNYAEKLNALQSAHKIDLESAAQFKARQDKERDQITEDKNIELAKLSTAMSPDSGTAPLKARIKALTEHMYFVGAEGIEAELGKYDADKHQFTIKLRSKLSALSLKLKDKIPLQPEEAELFKQQWDSGLIKPEAKTKINGDVVEIVLVNAGDNSRWMELKSMFYSPAALKTFSSSALNDLFETGKVIKDCVTCPAMIVLPAGSYDMGSNNGATDERPVHHVTLNRPFAMSKTEITQGEWKSVMGKSPSYFKNCGENCPVEQVSWNDAKEFIQKLNFKTGKVYRLPSEAEWEYACRAGTQQDYCGGDKADSVGWYSKNSSDLPHSAAQKQANAWGLYDMSGNVWEWVEDNYHTDYTGAPNDGSVWQGDNIQHVMRGGSWNLISELIRASVRSEGDPMLRDYYYGFRIVRELL